jgi:dihydroorotase
MPPAPRLILIRNGHVIDPEQRLDGPLDVLIERGKIVQVQPRDADIPESAYRVEAGGQIVCPGFVDLHVHLRFPGQPEKETMESGAAAAAAGGFTTVCAMANTRPVVDSVAVLQQVLAEAERVNAVRVRQIAALTCGLEGERLTDLAALADAGAVAFSDDGQPVPNPDLMRDALGRMDALNRTISAHEEDRALVGRGVANERAARTLDLPPWPCAGEAAMVERDIGLLREAGGRLHIAHVSCARSVELVRAAKAEGLPITAEVTPHHLLLSDRLLHGDKDLDLPPRHPNTKVNPPLRTEQDAEALITGLLDGTIDAIATDHAPHAATDKDRSYQEAAFGFTGSETALPLLLELVHAGRFSLPFLIETLTLGPARVFGLDAGTLRPGAPADITIFDPDAPWTVTPGALRSLGKNTPLMGRELRGRVSMTMVDGRIVHVEGV